MQLIKKILIGQDTFPVDYYDEEVPFSFHSNNGEKQEIILSLKNSIPLFELVNDKKTTYKELSKIGIDKVENLTDENRKYEYRYITFLSNDKNKFLIIFNFHEYRDYYSCHIYGVIEII